MGQPVSKYNQYNGYHWIVERGDIWTTRLVLTPGLDHY